MDSVVDHSTHGIPILSIWTRRLRPWVEVVRTVRGLGWMLVLLLIGPAVPPAVAEGKPQDDHDFLNMDVEQLGKVRVDTVYGASKYEQRTSEAPSSVSLVTQDEIQRMGYRTLADLLRSVRDFYVAYDRLYGYIGVRGFSRPGDFGGRMLILVDGHRLNEPLYDSAFNVTDFLLDLDLIERVEIIRGPGSTLYGNNAFFGVVNVVTRKGADVHGAEVAGSAGSEQAYQGRLTYGNRFKNGLELLVSGTHYDKEGVEKLYEPAFSGVNGGNAEFADGDRFDSLFTSMRYGRLEWEGGFISRTKNAPLGIYGTWFNQPQPTTDQRGFASVRFEAPLDEDTELNARLYYDYYRMSVKYPYEVVPPFGPSELLLNVEKDKAQWTGLEAMVSRQFLDNLKVTLGMEARYDFSLHFDIYNQDPFSRVSDLRENAVRYGLFLQEEWHVRTNLIVNGGMRYDWYETFGDTLNPRAALIYSPWKTTSWKVLFGRAYRSPSLSESKLRSVFQKPNPDLHPETISTYELVWEQEMARDWHFSVSGFYNKTKNLIGQTSDPLDGLLVFENLDSAETWGSSYEVGYRNAAGYSGKVGYTLQRTTDAATGAELSNSPRHLVKGQVSVPLWKEKLISSLEIQYSSRAGTTAGRLVPYADSYWVANLTLLSRKLAKNLDLSASLYNLFDEKFAYPAGDEYVPALIQQDGRTFRVKLTAHF